MRKDEEEAQLYTNTRNWNSGRYDRENDDKQDFVESNERPFERAPRASRPPPDELVSQKAQLHFMDGETEVRGGETTGPRPR